MNTPSLEQLQRGLQIAQQIAELEAQMAAIFQGKPISTTSSAPTTTRKSTKRHFSAQALANIRAAQKKRWAKVKGGKTTQAPKVTEKKKRKVSPAVRAKLAAAMKARWEAAKKSGGPAPTASKAKKK